MKARMKACSVLVAGSVLMLGATACSSSSGTKSTATTAAAGSNYTPRTWSVQMVTTQELIGEFGNIPGLKDEIDAALKPKGPLQGHEVYAWYPSSLTVYVGDTVNITIHNAQKDQHIFNLPDLGVAGKLIPPDGTITVSFKASKPNTFRYFCGVANHLPWMQGFLTVLPDSDAA